MVVLGPPRDQFVFKQVGHQGRPAVPKFVQTYVAKVQDIDYKGGCVSKQASRCNQGISSAGMCAEETLQTTPDIPTSNTTSNNLIASNCRGNYDYAAAAAEAASTQARAHAQSAAALRPAFVIPHCDAAHFGSRIVTHCDIVDAASSAVYRIV